MGAKASRIWREKRPPVPIRTGTYFMLGIRIQWARDFDARAVTKVMPPVLYSLELAPPVRNFPHSGVVQ